MIPVIFGLAGPTLSAEERAFFSAVEPAGFILFGRNIVDAAQLRSLTDDLRALTGRQALPVLIDQEGGRVARLKAPHWPAYPCASDFDDLYRQAPASALAAARSNGLALALTLAAVGVNVNCAPMLDIRHAGAHDIVGDRSYGADPVQVAALGRAMLDGLEAGGVAGVIKHIPGHGRARCDSHLDLPRVDASAEQLEQDIAPFAALAKQARIAMTAHIVYPTWDPQWPATLSETIISSIVRHRIGFEGLLLTDDIEMNALAGPVPQRGQAALTAGCDLVLHCSGELSAMQALAAALPPIAPASLDRLERALPTPVAEVSPDCLAKAIMHRDELLALTA